MTRPAARRPGGPPLVIDVVTLFPDVIAPFASASIPGRAAAAGLVRYNLVQLRDFTHDRHQTVDDYAYGGGAGMVLKPEPFFEAVDSLGPSGPIVLLSARGRRFGHDDAVRFSLGERRRCRSATSCSPGARRRRSACWTRWCGCCRAR
jgi:tRNA (guanine-N1)-methyltransferase